MTSTSSFLIAAISFLVLSAAVWVFVYIGHCQRRRSNSADEEFPGQTPSEPRVPKAVSIFPPIIVALIGLAVLAFITRALAPGAIELVIRRPVMHIGLYIALSLLFIALFHHRYRSVRYSTEVSIIIIITGLAAFSAMVPESPSIELPSARPNREVLGFHLIMLALIYAIGAFFWISQTMTFPGVTLIGISLLTSAIIRARREAILRSLDILNNAASKLDNAAFSIVGKSRNPGSFGTYIAELMREHPGHAYDTYCKAVSKAFQDTR